MVFRVHFCKSEVRVPFYIHFSFILSFNFEKKWKQNEVENDRLAIISDPDVRRVPAEYKIGVKKLEQINNRITLLTSGAF